MSEEEVKAEEVVFYFSIKNGRKVRVSQGEWEREWFSWWKKTSKERSKREAAAVN